MSSGRWTPLVRWLRGLLWAIVVVLLLLVAGLVWVLATQRGLETVLALTSRVLPGFSVGSVEGCLLGPLQLRDLRYRDASLELDLARLEFDWLPSQLWQGQLHVERLRLDGLHVNQLQASPPVTATEPFSLQDLAPPLAVTVNELTASDLQFQPADAATPIHIERLELQAAVREQTLHLTRLAVVAPQGRAQLAGQLGLTGANPLQLTLDGTLPLPNLAPLDLRARIGGELQQTLQVGVDLAGPVTATLNGELQQVLTAPRWSAQLDLKQLTLGQWSPDLRDSVLSGQVQGQGTLDRFQTKANLATHLPTVGPVQAVAELAGDPATIQIKSLQLRSDGRLLAVTAQGTLRLAELSVDASGGWQGLTWPLTGPPQVESSQGEFSVQGKLDDYRLKLTAALTGPELGRLTARLAASGNEQRVRLDELNLQAPNSPRTVSAKGEFNLSDQTWRLDGDWQQLAWPLVGTPQVESLRGNVQAGGTLQAYRFQLTAQVQGTDLPSGDWRLEGQGTAQGLPAVNLDGRLLGGELRGTLNLAWQPEPRWQTALTGNNLNPAEKWPQWPGRLAFKLENQGSVTQGTLRTVLNLAELSGTLNQQPVQGKGRVELDGQAVRIQDLQVTAGQIKLEAAGELNQRWDLRWQLAAPELGRLLPGASGRLNSKGTVQGMRAQPLVELTVDGDALKYRDNALQRLRVSAGVDVSGTRRSQFKLDGDGLQTAGRRWRTLHLEGAGTPDNHNLQADLAGEMGRFALALQGRFNSATQAWQGQLTRLTAQETAAGNWQLDQPIALQASARQARLEPGCLVSAPTRVCLQGRWDATAGAEGRVSLDRLDLARFAFLLPPGVKLETAILSGEASGSRRADGSLRGNTNLRLSPTRLRFQANGTPVTLATEGGELRAESNGNEVTARLTLDLGQLGRAAGNVQVRDLRGAGQLGGNLTAEINDLSLVSVLVPELQQVKGQVQADVKLAGTLAAPLPGGTLRLTGGTADIPRLDVHLREIEFDATSSDGGRLWRLSGGVRSTDSRGSARAGDEGGRVRPGDGRLKLLGRWQPGGRLDLGVIGQDFVVADAPGLRARINPDLTVVMEQGQVQVNGQVVIPRARLNAGGEAFGEGVVSPSPDVIIVTRADGTAPPTTSPATAVAINVRIVLGDDIWVKAFDFRGKLKGNLLIEKAPNLPPRGTGTIQVATGEYLIYNQPLQIERGRVLFSGGPLDNPGLDLRVQRTAPAPPTSGPGGAREVTVGAQVSGTLRNPRLTLFSRPAMPDSSILSYLATGQPPESSGNTSLTLGRYLRPDLYVGYRLGLSGNANTFVLRYRLTRRLDLEATTSSEQSGADLFYTIERP
jgi:translocation and assembly module TamB